MRTSVQVSDAPAAIGPYSQGQVVRLHGGNRMLFTSGQIALDPGTGSLVEGDTARQTEQVLKNLTAVLRGAGLGLEDVMKTTVYLVDMADFQSMNQVYEKAFGAARPARTTIAAAGLPKGARVEIDAIAMGRDL
jgi:2-iminobutanoate/2-iminopropanoate deaminase